MKKENRDKVIDGVKDTMKKFRLDESDNIGKGVKEAIDKFEQVMDIGDSLAAGLKAFTQF